MNVADTSSIYGDLLAAGLGAAILLGYHGWIERRQRGNPAFTIQSVHALARTAWVESVMGSGRDILAVQTLRNSTMAATFLASTAILLIVGLLTLSGQGDKLELTWDGLSRFHPTDPLIWLVKLLALIVDLGFAFFSFTLAIRKFHHVGYLLNVPPEWRQRWLTPAYVAAYLNRAGRCYTLGMRAYYFLLPLVLWLMGPALMMAGCVALVVVLYRLDRAEIEMESELVAVGEDWAAEPAAVSVGLETRAAGRMAGSDPGGLVAAAPARMGPGVVAAPAAMAAQPLHPHALRG